MTEPNTKPSFPPDAELDGMNHAKLGDVLLAQGASEDDLKTPGLGSKEKRRAAIRALATAGHTEPATGEEESQSGDDTAPIAEGDPEPVQVGPHIAERQPLRAIHAVETLAREAEKARDFSRHAKLQGVAGALSVLRGKLDDARGVLAENDLWDFLDAVYREL